MLRDLVLKNRSTRRFSPDPRPAPEDLRGLVALARLCPSGANLQPLRFLLSADEERNARIFPHLRWAGYLKEWPGPAEGERPTAYIVVLGDTDRAKAFGCDHGIAAQTILLGAAEKGYAGCMIASMDREGLREALAIPPRFEVLLSLALGTPGEEIVLEDLGRDGDVRYRRDEGGVHRVPKRSLEDLLFEPEA